MSTDVEWEKWGRQDPYFGVITYERFRTKHLDEAALAEFFQSGDVHVQCVLQSCKAYVGQDFSPRRVLDFGCGVGRLVIPFAALAERVTGVDVSPGMLEEATRNCEERSLTNVELLLSDDDLSRVQGQFDLVHSAITLQHIEVARGRHLFKRLLDLLAPEGVMAMHLTYAKAYHPETMGQPPEILPAGPPGPALVQAPPRAGLWARLLRRTEPPVAEVPPPSTVEPPPADPQMLMNPYDLNHIAYLMQIAGINRFHAEFTDHGGELGVFLFARKP